MQCDRTIAEIEALLWYWLTPLSFKPSRLTPGDKKLRDQLPVSWEKLQMQSPT
ncbi:MAG: hypothetical protein QQW96_16375 [Tychonema bourrellyi B0820]|uniref:hypothetical protein n=1 Tax=Tychonema bourrellyi TaxID=54313 RepID=UPI0015D46D04|nr:hypothetical protein [Tychonema bourrellyi]MDQ2099207.1 hypothetical protein [Tychonema bourrellyi B0820]